MATAVLNVPSSNDSETRALQNFPTDIFDATQRYHGALILHILGGVYACYALYVICEYYYIPSLQIIIKKLGFAHDIAGATLMAIGSSTPGLFTTLIGTFITDNDLGLGNIIGSCMFNIYAIIGVCGIIIKKEIPMEWWPVTRDCSFVIFSLIMLVVYICDNKIYWYECVASILTYALYILILCFDRRLKSAIEQFGRVLHTSVLSRCRRSPKVPPTTPILDCSESRQQIQITPATTVVAPQQQNPEKSVRIEMSLREKPSEKGMHLNGTDNNMKQLPITEAPRETKEKHSRLSMPDGTSKQVLWWITLPITLLYYLTIPNCTNAKWRRFYVVTFVTSIAYIGIVTYFVSWMVTIFGSTFNIPDDIMGFTVLAIGTSMPDLFCSICVARQGHANMALSNALGSNVIDILISLGLPWLIRSSIMSNDGFIPMGLPDTKYIIAFMIWSVLLMYFVLAGFHFRLNLKVGCIALALYAIFLVTSTIYSEMN